MSPLPLALSPDVDFFSVPASPFDAVDSDELGVLAAPSPAGVPLVELLEELEDRDERLSVL